MKTNSLASSLLVCLAESDILFYMVFSSVAEMKGPSYKHILYSHAALGWKESYTMNSLSKKLNGAKERHDKLWDEEFWVPGKVEAGLN